MTSILQAFPTVATLSSTEGKDPDHSRSGLHSGDAADIIYSLPTCRMLGINHLILNLCSDPTFGDRVLTERDARALAPLLLAQKFIRRVTIIKSNVPWEFANPADLGVDYILDSFRASYTDRRLHVLNAHAVPFSLAVDGSQPWVTVDRDAGEQRVTQDPYVVVALTNRNRRFQHDYYERLFRDIPPERVFFVGAENGQIEQRDIGGTAFRAANLVDLAKLLANASLFIGNPSLSYALAEGLKVTRFVETPEESNVYPLDGSGAPLHMFDPEYVRSRIFGALELPDDASHCYSAMTSRVAQLEAENSSMQEREQALRAEVANMTSQEQALQAEIGHLTAQEQTLRAEIVRHRAETARLRAIEQSTMWKASRPLRTFLGHLSPRARRS